jgi:hypothetical protein
MGLGPLHTVNLKEARDRARKAGNLGGGRILILIAARQRWRHGNLRTSEIDVCSRLAARRPPAMCHDGGGSTGNAIRPKGYLAYRGRPSRLCRGGSRSLTFPAVVCG